MTLCYGSAPINDYQFGEGKAKDRLLFINEPYKTKNFNLVIKCVRKI